MKMRWIKTNAFSRQQVRVYYKGFVFDSVNMTIPSKEGIVGEKRQRKSFLS